jgi:hypothetical protein
LLEKKYQHKLVRCLHSIELIMIICELILRRNILINIFLFYLNELVLEI